MSHGCPEFDADRKHEPLGLLSKDNITKMLKHEWGQPATKRQRAEVADEPEEEAEIRGMEQGEGSHAPHTDYDARFEAFQAVQDQRWEETQLRWATQESRIDQMQAEQRQWRAQQEREFRMMQAMMRDMYLQQRHDSDAPLPPHFQDPSDPSGSGH